MTTRLENATFQGDNWRHSKRSKNIDLRHDVGHLPTSEQVDVLPGDASGLNKGSNLPIHFIFTDETNRIDESTLRYQFSAQTFKGGKNIGMKRIVPRFSDMTMDVRNVPGYMWNEEHYHDVLAEARKGLHTINMDVRTSNKRQHETEGALCKGREHGSERDANIKKYPELNTGLPFETVEPNPETWGLDRINDNVLDYVPFFPTNSF